MDLEIRNNQLVWVKDDGTVSEKPVSTMTLIDHCGFPYIYGPGGGECKGIKIIKGNPFKDEIILVQAFGNSWGGSYLISKETLEYIKIYEGDMSAAEALVDNPPNRAYFLEDLIEKKRQEKRFRGH